MHWVGLGAIMFFIAPERGMVYFLPVIATLFYILYVVSIFIKNLRFHYCVWSLSLIWNAFLLKKEILGTGSYAEGDVIWLFKAASFWVLSLSLIFLVSQAINYAKRKNCYQKYLNGLEKFRALGTPKGKT